MFICRSLVLQQTSACAVSPQYRKCCIVLADSQGIQTLGVGLSGCLANWLLTLRNMWEGRSGGGGRGGGRNSSRLGVNRATHTFGRNLLFYFVLAAV